MQPWHTPLTPLSFLARSADVFPDVTGALGREIRGRRVETSTDLATVVLEEAEVAAVPGEAFGAPGHLRFSYALNDADLAEGIDRVASLLAE